MPAPTQPSMTLEQAIVLADEASVRKMIPFYIGTDELDHGLRAAVMAGMPDMAEILLKAGANPDVRTPARDREAEAAARPRLPPEVQAEVAEITAAYEESKQANPRLTDEYEEYSDLLVLAVDPYEEDADLATPLIHLCESSFAILEPAMMWGEIEYDTIQDAKWLDRARTTQAKLIAHLLAAGADVNARDTIDRTPLLAVASADDIGVKLMCPGGYHPLGPLEPLPTVERLISAGADVNARDVAKNSILLMMASVDAKIVRLLVDAGAEINCQNRHGYSPLQYAAMAADPEAIAILLAAGADIDPRDENGFTPLHHLLHWASSDTMGECKASLAALQALIEAGAELDARAVKGRTPLHLAAGEGAIAELVRAMLDAGAARDAVDELGTTPYDLAVRMGSEHLIPILRGTRRPR